MAGAADPGALKEARRLTVEPAAPSDEPGIRALLREQPLGGSIRITLEREPDSLLAAGVDGDPHHRFVVRQAGTGKVVAIGGRAVWPVWVNGCPAKVGYLGLLRRRPELAGRIRLLAEGFAAGDRTRRADELPYDLTSVVAENVAARRLLERGLPALPCYRPLCEFRTLLIPAGRRRAAAIRRGATVRRGSDELIPAIVDCLQRNLERYQFAPRWTEEDLRSPERSRGLRPEDFFLLERRSRVVGCLARWDQRPFKQVVVRGYPGWIARWRPALNAALGLAGRPRLPAVGSPLRLAYLSHVAIDGDEPEDLLALIRAARAASAGTGIEALALGLAEENPMGPAVERSFSPRAFRSVIYAVHRAGAEPSLAELDRRPLHLEVARL